MCRLAASVITSSIVSLHGAGAQGGAPTVVPDDPLCPRCTIEVLTLVTLGSDDGPGSIAGRPMSVNVDARGRYWVFQELEPPTVFTATGAVIQVVGRKGSGPGEFRAANNGLAIGDSMLVFDWIESRATIIGPDLKAGRIIRNPYRSFNGILVSWPDLVVHSGYLHESAPPNSTLHRLSFSGAEPRLLGSFGPRGSGGSMGSVEVGQILGPGREGRVWSTYWNRAEFTRWTRTGTRELALRRRYDWYTGETPASPGRPGTPPTPMTASISEDEAGLVWLFIHTPAPTWNDAWPDNAARQREIRSRDVAWNSLYRTYVEVMDPVRARVVARQQVDGYILHTLPGGRAAFYRVDDDGIPRVQIVSLSLSGR